MDFDEWFNSGAKSGWYFATLEEAIAAKNPPQKDLQTFERGYLTGRITSLIFNFQSWLRFMDNDSLKRLGDSLQVLSEQHNKELSRPDAPYKLGKVPNADS